MDDESYGGGHVEIRTNSVTSAGFESSSRLVRDVAIRELENVPLYDLCVAQGNLEAGLGEGVAALPSFAKARRAPTYQDHCCPHR